jgi:hypothetical protein
LDGPQPLTNPPGVLLSNKHTNLHALYKLAQRQMLLLSQTAMIRYIVVVDVYRSRRGISQQPGQGASVTTDYRVVRLNINSVHWHSVLTSCSRSCGIILYTSSRLCS